jgi:hypothetical protein
MGGRLLPCVSLGILILSTACMDRLPDQDLRILSATPVARLSADILWKEYESDPDAADDAYWGKPIVVTGTVTAVSPDGVTGPFGRYVEFGQADTATVRAHLLDEQAAQILESAKPDERLTLKCFCEGKPATAEGNVLLKSCVTP